MDSASAECGDAAGTSGPASNDAAPPGGVDTTSPGTEVRSTRVREDERAPLSGFRVMVPVAAAVLLVDQLTKIWAVERLSARRTIDLFWTLRFRLVRNEGAAFGLGTDFTVVIALAQLAIAVAVVWFGRRVTRIAVLVPLGLILGGALGNVVDRFLRSGDGFARGAVVDFIDLQWYPVFNVADMAIVLGGIALVLVMREDDVHRRSHSA